MSEVYYILKLWNENARKHFWRVCGHKGATVMETFSEAEALNVRNVANSSHAHATAAAARRVRELEEALAAMVRAFESGWPSHATESIGGLGHMPGESCNACRMMRPYKDAQSALAGKERTDGAE